MGVGTNGQGPVLSEPGVIMSSPGGLVVSRACEDMAENQWLSLEPIGLSLAADMISVCVGGSSSPGLLAWLRVFQKVLRYLEGGSPGGAACSIFGGSALEDGLEPEIYQFTPALI